MRWMLALLIVSAALVVCQARAEANVHFCNTTPLPVNVAIAMRWTDAATGADYQAVQGWFTIEGGMCQTPIPFDPAMHSFAFYYAPDSHDETWEALAEPRSYCANEFTNFMFWNSFPDTPCEAPARKHKFHHVETGRNDLTVVFLAGDASLSI